ncbi:hypothetical protein ES332_A03G129500v1 [Gossypium tomentosum]|uniref:Uncharacterized protein n=1 Tax=Gossypium tomentosum TaxID=34277 RepID=A0A5D2R783_GOSTO|nr:hypothetical protein ES332_A03G129500v1 [Gossypium tomentosum]
MLDRRAGSRRWRSTNSNTLYQSLFDPLNMNMELDSPKIAPNYTNLCLNIRTSPCPILKFDC